MDYNSLRRERDGMQMYCRDCQRYPQSVPYEEWQGAPWQERTIMPGIRRPGRMYEYEPMSEMPRHVGMPQYQPMPYHMAYPYPLFMQETDEDEKDMEKIISMFPETARHIQPIVEEECDRMEYDGSLMFDEYPDKSMMERIIESIYQRVQSSAATEMAEEENEVFATQCRNCGGRSGDGLQDLISVMLFEEMHRRRCRHRRCKRWW